MDQNDKRFYDFGPFTLNATQRSLVRAGQTVPLGSKAFQTLLMLVENRARVVTRDELLSGVWPKTTVVESSLNQQIRNIRRALGDHSRNPSQYIQTVAGEGYSFIADVTERREPGHGAKERPAEIPNLSLERKRSVFWMLLAIAVSGSLVGIAIEQLPTPETQVPVRLGRLLAKSTSEGHYLTTRNLDQKPSFSAVSPDGGEFYTATELSRTLSILHLSTGRVTKLSLPRDVGPFVMSQDGKTLYILSPSGGIVVVNTGSALPAARVIPTPGPAYNGALTPNGQKLFVTMNRLGVWRVLTTTGQLRQVTNQICPIYLGLDARGQTLVVSYQCGGPKGSAGHDSVEIFDTETEASLGIVSGPPFVGGPLSISPDGRQVILDGLDVCMNPDYDHQGCPSVPSHVFNFLRLPDRQFVRTIGTPSATTGVARFLDLGRVLFTGSSLTVMETSQYVVTEKWEDNARTVFGDRPMILPVLRKVFIPFFKQEKILILDAESPECSAPPEGLALFYPGDGTGQDAIGGAHLTANGGVRFGPGRVGQAFLFDGKSGYLVAPWTPFYDFGVRDSSITMYVKFASVDHEMTLFEHSISQSRRVARLTKGSDRRFHFEFVTSDGTSLRLSSITSTFADQWYQLCVTKNNERAVLYVNGRAEDSQMLRAETSLRVEPRFPFYLGSTYDRQYFLHGKLDEILFYSRVLSETEVRNLYEMRESGPCKL